MRTAFLPSRLGTQLPPSPTAWIPSSHSTGSDPRWFAGKARTISPFSGLLNALQRARTAIGQLADDWDDEGSPAIDADTLRRAAILLLLHAAMVWVRFAAIVPTPRILPGPEGSIDLHWKTRQRELLINVPRNPEEPASYYGDDFGPDRQKGMIKPRTIDLELFAWLTLTD